jgi:hypothetical protein
LIGGLGKGHLVHVRRSITSAAAGNQPQPALVEEEVAKREAEQVKASDVFEGNAHDLLVATYRGRYRPTPIQLGAAAITIAYKVQARDHGLSRRHGWLRRTTAAGDC